MQGPAPSPVIESGQSRILRKGPKRIAIQSVTENQPQRDPEDAPASRLPHGNLVRTPVEQAQIQHEQELDEPCENGIEAPVLVERKELRGGHWKRAEISDPDNSAARR